MFFFLLNKFNFQDPATPLMLGIIDVHHNIFFYLIVIFFLVSWLLLRSLFEAGDVYKFVSRFVSLENTSLKKYDTKEKPYKIFKFYPHCSTLETVWTLVPSIILLFIAYPSLSLLYSMEETFSPQVTAKIIGHQWYWSYETSKFVGENESAASILRFDSNLAQIPSSENYLYQTDRALKLPTFTKIRLLITSEDVLHSWAVPSFGIKTDACPGRLNQVLFEIIKPGIFFGQCSELCGLGHGFMPITVEALDKDSF